MGLFNKSSIHDYVLPLNDPSFASQALFQELRHRVFLLADLRSSQRFQSKIQSENGNLQKGYIEK